MVGAARGTVPAAAVGLREVDEWCRWYWKATATIVSFERNATIGTTSGARSNFVVMVMETRLK